MKRIIVAAPVAATTTALAVALPTLAAGGTTNPLGVKIVCNATAYPYADDIRACTITTTGQPIYNVRIRMSSGLVAARLPPTRSGTCQLTVRSR
jgi:hypothetical protein